MVDGIEKRVILLNTISTLFSSAIFPVDTKLVSQRTRYELYRKATRCA